MARTYNRNKTKRLNDEVALEHMTSEQELQEGIAEAEQAHEDYEDFVNNFLTPRERWQEHEEDMNAIDRAHGRKNFFRRMHETAHRGDQILNPEESHHALVDHADREAQERKMLALAELDMGNMTDPDEWF